MFIVLQSSVFLKKPTPRSVGLKRNLLMLCFLSPLFDTAFPLFHEWYPVSLGLEITMKGFLFLVFHVKRKGILVDNVSLIKLSSCFFNLLLKIYAVHLLCWHYILFCFVLRFFGRGVAVCEGVLSPSYMMLLLILVPLYLWGFNLQFGSHHSGNLRILMSWSSYGDHCRCWEPLWGI